MNAKELMLRVVALDDVLMHEQIETKRVERLVERLRTDRILKNPPVVAESNGKYILLDGASRVTALKRIGCCDTVAQIVAYDSPGVALETWNHFLLDAPVGALFASLERVPGLRVESVCARAAENALTQRASIATLLLEDDRALSLVAADRSLEQETRLLNQVVATYEGRGELYRVAHTDLPRLRTEHGRPGALFIFPRYRPDEIRRLAHNGAKLPTGITRHIIPGRALRVNVPLEILEGQKSAETKVAWLDEWMRVKMRERQVRFYQEPVFLFDE